MPQDGLHDMKMAEYLQDPQRKQHYVTTVFEIVAPSYDRFTCWCSMGMDMAWKRKLLTLVKGRLAPHHRVVDLACGTGDLTFPVARLVPEGTVHGLDVAEPMIHLAEQKRCRRQVANVAFQVGDIMALPFPSASVDGVTIGYGLRNVPDARGALAEIHRVLKAGGFLVSLDFARPANPIWRRLFLSYLLLAGNFYGWLWHREPAVYAYLAYSIDRFLTVSELSSAIAQAGFEGVAEHPCLFDAVCIHVAQKKS